MSRCLASLGVSMVVACSGSPRDAEVVLPAADAPVAAGAQTVALFEGSVDPARGVMNLVVRSPEGEVRAQSTLPYGGGPGDVYFHTCTSAFDPSGHTLSGTVQAVDLMGFHIGSLNAVVDSISVSGVTLASGPGAGSTSGIIAKYGNVVQNTANCSSSTTWSFSDPTSASFAFKGHADGTPALTGAAGGWLFDEGSGTTALDFVGTDNAPITSGTYASGASCHSGACLVFNNSTSRVAVPYTAALKFGTGDFTAAAWIKMGSDGNENIVVGPNRCTVGESWLLSVDSHKAAFATFGTGSTGGYLHSAASVDDNAWHAIAGVRSGTTLRLYLDGVQVGTSSLSASFNSDAGGAVMTIGNLFGCTGREFGGTIDSVRVFSRALSTAEIAGL